MQIHQQTDHTSGRVENEGAVLESGQGEYGKSLFLPNFTVELKSALKNSFLLNEKINQRI